VPFLLKTPALVDALAGREKENEIPVFWAKTDPVKNGYRTISRQRRKDLMADIVLDLCSLFASSNLTKTRP
jgi:hypothetical protein